MLFASFSVFSVNIIYPVFHQRIAVIHFFLISEISIQCIRKKCCNISPYASGILFMSDIRHIIRHSAIDHLLFIPKIFYKLMEKCTGVHMVTCRRSKYLRISGPSKTFISLRTIGRHIEEIRFQSPNRIFIQTINFFVICMDISRSLQIRIQYVSSECFFLQFPCPSGHTDITETEKCKMRTHGFRFSAGDIDKLGSGFPIVFPIKIIVL